MPKKNTLKNYEHLLPQFCDRFGLREAESITAEEILSFLTEVTEGSKQSTKRLRYSLLSSFFNFIIHSIDPDLQNPCDTPMLKKIFRVPKATQWKILDKETVDEIIFRTENQRNRLLLELMARGGMRVSEVLKLTPKDIEDRKIIIRESKSGREAEVVFIPRKLADRLKAYVRDEGIDPDQRVFPIKYAMARVVVKKAGRLVGIHLRPHDLRRHAATYASRAGTPIEIVS
ncbi:MAG: site-specific integrase, partial [Desulfobacteraceae bacterium]